MKIKKIDRFSVYKDKSARGGEYVILERTPANAALWDDGSDRKLSDDYINNPKYKGGYNEFFMISGITDKKMADIVVSALNSNYSKVPYIEKSDINEKIDEERIKLKSLINRR